MATLRQRQLKQLNALDRAITNIVKAIKIGEKEEQLGYNNGALARIYEELLEVYEEQVKVEERTQADRDRARALIDNYKSNPGEYGI